MTIPPRVDLSRWCPEKDRMGRVVKPGDRVRSPLYPRGTIEGILELSNRAWCVLPSGEEIGELIIRTDDGDRYSASENILLLGSDNPDAIDRSQHPTVVEYGVREMMKGKSPRAAARATERKLSGYENIFLGPGIAHIDPSVLEDELWNRLADFTIEGMRHYREGKEHYAIDATLQHFQQKPRIRSQLKKLVVVKLGRDPFIDENPATKRLLVRCR